VEQIAKLAFERKHPCFHLRIAGQQYAAPGALGNVHAANIANSPAISCASFESVNGYAWLTPQVQVADAQELGFFHQLERGLAFASLAAGALRQGPTHMKGVAIVDAFVLV